MNRRTTFGFTAIELLVTMAVAAVLMAVAAPSFKALMKNNQLATTTNNLTADLALMRTEASNRARPGTRITMCPSTNATTCSTTTPLNWAVGRIIFVDGGTYGVVNSSDEILRVTPALTSNEKLTVTGFTNYIQYRQNGSANNTTTATLKICDDRTGSFGRIISISTNGRPSLSTGQSCP
jgi:type IV fimbrial biogenesis protein FimT